MIQERKGNLLDVTEGIICHGCNQKGAMNAGVAAAVRSRYSDAYIAYRRRFEKAGLFLGDIVTVVSHRASDEIQRQAHFVSAQVPANLIVVNAITQESYGRNPSIRYVDYDAVEAAFVRVRWLARKTGLAVHIPLIGCGLANGKWEEVEPRIERALDGVPVTLWTL